MKKEKDVRNSTIEIFERSTGKVIKTRELPLDAFMSYWNRYYGNHDKWGWRLAPTDSAR